MRRFLRVLLRSRPSAASTLEASGLGLTALGINELSTPAALIFAGAALVFIAQGMERGG